MRLYYSLIKPGIVYSNALIAAAAFLFASRGAPDLWLLAATLLGLSLIVAAACVANNIYDRDIDALMERTKSRALAAGAIRPPSALLFALVLGIAGIATLFFYTNLEALGAALLGLVVYLALYTPLKRLTPHATLVGAVAGATPPVVGYTAVVGSVDTIAVMLFLVLFAWQMAHFLAIALYRLPEYQAAGVPVAPVRLGEWRTAVLMLLYVVLFAYAILALHLASGTPLLFLLALALSILLWLFYTLRVLFARGARREARQSFFASIGVLLVFALALSLA